MKTLEMLIPIASQLSMSVSSGDCAAVCVPKQGSDTEPVKREEGMDVTHRPLTPLRSCSGTRVLGFTSAALDGHTELLLICAASLGPLAKMKGPGRAVPHQEQRQA